MAEEVRAWLPVGLLPLALESLGNLSGLSGCAPSLALPFGLPVLTFGLSLGLLWARHLLPMERGGHLLPMERDIIFIIWRGDHLPSDI